MMEPVDAEAWLEKHRASLPIPAQAKLAYVERRAIELASHGELEPLTPMADAASSSDEEVEVEPEPATGKSVDTPARPSYTEVLAWVGRFAYQIFSWELAIDESGNLIRIRKSR